MNEDAYPKTLFAAIVIGGVCLGMGGAFFYFTSGVVMSCERSGTAQASCTEGRRILGLIDIPLRTHPAVVGAGYDERKAYDDEGDEYKDSVAVLLTPAGKQDLAPFGVGQAFGSEEIQQLDAFAKNPTAEGLTVGHQAWGAYFAVHLFSSLIIFLGFSNIIGYAMIRLRRRRG